jgi:hypothetical protein
LLHLSNGAGPPFHKIIAINQIIEFPIGTTDAFVADAREADAVGHLKRLLDLTRAETTRLSRKDLVALSGEVYRTFVALNEADPGESLSWRYHKALRRAILEGRISGAPPAIFVGNDAANRACRPTP